MRFLLLGSKEFPVGSGSGFDALPSGGFERYTQDLAFALAQKNQVAIVVTRKFPNQPSFETKGNLAVRRVPWISGFLTRSPSFNFSAFLAALKLDFDIVFASGLVASFFGVLLKLLKRKPLIARPAGIGYTHPQYGFLTKALLEIAERLVYRWADAVVFLSEEEKKNFQEKLSFLPKKFKVIHTGIDVSRFASKPGRIPKGKKMVLFLGRLIAVKGVDVLLEAAKSISPNARIAIGGAGPEREKLEKLASQKNLKNVVFLGHVEKPEAELAKCDVFVLPSFSEGLPIALLEAMAARKPCVVTDIGLPVENGVNALVVKSGDSKSLAAAVNKLLRDEKLARKIAENGFNHVKKNFSWNEAASKIIALATEVKRK